MHYGKMRTVQLESPPQTQRKGQVRGRRRKSRRRGERGESSE